VSLLTDETTLYIATEREKEKETEMKHSRVQINGDSVHIIMVPVTEHSSNITTNIKTDRTKINI
jgi:hypothetical protein